MSSTLREPALKALATQVLSARRRLAMKTGGKPPSVAELAVALRMYLSHCDSLRDTEPERRRAPCQAFKTHMEKKELRRFVGLASLAYETGAERLQEKGALNAMSYGEPEFRLVCSRHSSDIWEPAYFVALYAGPRELVVVIRGTLGPADVLTDVSMETEKLLDGEGHRGVVRSARWLLGKIHPTLKATVESNDVERVIFTGHSLGAAVAAAATLMLRCEEAVDIPDVLRNASCIALCSPPFLCESLAKRSENMGITTVVNGLDCIPRMSAASLDRFCLRVATFDWSEQLNATTAQVAGNLLPKEHVERLQETVVAAFAPYNRALLKSDLVPQEDRIDDTMARALGVQEDTEEQPDMFLAGEVVHIDVPLTQTKYMKQGDLPEVASMRRVSRNAFKDIEASELMVQHHKLVFLREQLDLMLTRKPNEGGSLKKDRARKGK